MRPGIAFVSAIVICAAAFADAPPPIPNTPASVTDIVYARPFTLDQGYRDIRSKERPWVTAGTLLVLKVDPALVFPREISMPVLYAGDRPVERINRGNESGYLIVVASGPFDLRNDPVWFGAPDFPHNVDTATAQAQRTLAENAGVQPFPQKRVQAALTTGGQPLKKADMTALLRDEIADLILKYSPQEKQLADGFRIPPLRHQTATTSEDAAEQP